MQRLSNSSGVSVVMFVYQFVKAVLFRISHVPENSVYRAAEENYGVRDVKPQQKHDNRRNRTVYHRKVGDSVDVERKCERADDPQNRYRYSTRIALRAVVPRGGKSQYADGGKVRNCTYYDKSQRQPHIRK